MKRILGIVWIASSIACSAQKRVAVPSLSDKIRKSFPYDSLTFLSCINTPVGIYAIKFKVDEKKRFYGFVALSDSFRRLNNLFVDAIKKSASSSEAKKMHKGDYLQIIYFNNLVFCNDLRDKNDFLRIAAPPDTSVSFLINYDKEIIERLSRQLVSIERSLVALQTSVLRDERVVVLPPAIITNHDPNAEKGKPGFENDTPPNTLSKEQIERIEQIMNERKKKAKQ